MSFTGIGKTLAQIAAGYSRTFKRIAWSIILLGGAVAVSAAIVFPLWYFSTHDRNAYTTVVLSVFGAGLLFLLFRKTHTFWGLPSAERVARVRRTAGKAVLVLAYLVGLYIVLGFYVVGLLAIAVPLTIAYLLALGYTLYGRKSRIRR